MDSSPSNVRKACDGSLRRLGIDTIDLYYQPGSTPRFLLKKPLERWPTWFVRKGARLGLSRQVLAHCDARPLCTQLPLSRPSIRFGLAMLSAMARLQHVASWASASSHSPLGRGFLTGAIRKPSDLAADDWRHTNPRFQGGLRAKSSACGARAELRRGRLLACTARIGLVLAQGDDIVPIPVPSASVILRTILAL
jgi:aryl-alcohol dehydrogenase-like predicted oxidoreductase